MTYAQPTTLDEALGLLAAGPWAILSGGTDFYPGSLERSLPSRILDIHALSELRQIRSESQFLRIGAGATWSDIIAAPLPPAFDGLKLAAREVGSVQIQNRATLAGNLCNASPAADGVPPLLTLNAEVELSSTNGTRRLPVREFILGNRHIARQPNEMVTAVLVPAAATDGVATFVKLGARKYLVISISMVAARLVCDDEGLVSAAAVSVGSCSLVACRLDGLEALLLGQPCTAGLGELVLPEHVAMLAPIGDVRSTVDYRMAASLELVRRALVTLGNEFYQGSRS